jgi:hypothetical protein
MEENKYKLLEKLERLSTEDKELVIDILHKQIMKELDDWTIQ